MRVPLRETLAAGSRGVNDPLGRAWGQTARAGGGSFTPRLLLLTGTDGRHKTPPFQGAAVARDAAQVPAATWSTRCDCFVPQARRSAAQHGDDLARRVEDTPLRPSSLSASLSSSTSSPTHAVPTKGRRCRYGCGSTWHSSTPDATRHDVDQDRRT